jgi:predicted RNase H-like HicB family nuclease
MKLLFDQACSRGEDFSKEGFNMQLTAVYMQVPEGYIAFVEELPGANTQGDTLEEARENLREAVALVLEANRELAERSLVGQTVTRETFDFTVP